MKKIIAILLVLFSIAGSMFSLYSCVNPGGNGNVGSGGSGSSDKCPSGHKDANSDDYCDVCGGYVIVVVDFYAVNDLHGSFCDSSSQPGVDGLATYFRLAEMSDEHIVLLSSGDNWQGAAESNLTGGNIITEWMNLVGFDAMTLGNHDFDWGEDAIRDNLEIAEFPFLAINVYNIETGELAEYCTPSIMIERGGIQIGIIGAVGDCYSSIASNMVEEVEFKVGAELAALVRAESERLRAAGADFIVYSLHDGHDSSSNSNKVITNSNLNKYYTPSLSDGYVDLVFEAHTHQSYTLYDVYGVYHLQAGGENKGISHVEVAINSVSGEFSIEIVEVVNNSEYAYLPDDEATEELEDKYSDVVDNAYAYVGTVSKYYSDYALEDVVAELYLEAGLERWGDEYDILLGGGFLRTRSPYNLSAGRVTYANLLSLLPFDNQIVLCSIKGSKLKSRFINNKSDDYHISLSDFGLSNKNQIVDSQTYYIITDSYTALYEYNGLTIVEYYDYTTFARDLLAEAIKNGEI